MSAFMLRNTALAALALAPALLAQPALAGGLDLGLPVTITNSPLPVSVGGTLTVHNADNPALQPYTLSSATGSCAPALTGFITATTAQVPAGKTLVIESIDLMANLPTTYYPTIYLNIASSPTLQTFHVIPVTLQGSNLNASIYLANQLVKYYVPGGSELQLALQGISSNGLNAPADSSVCISQFSINGYLVNTP